MPGSRRPPAARRDPSDRLWRFSEELTAVCILGALWMICSLPVVTAGAATAALCEVLLLRFQRGIKGLVRPFFHAFRSDFGRATRLWLIVLPVMGLLGTDVWYYLTRAGGSLFARLMGGLMLCLFAAAGMIAVYVFPAAVTWEQTARGTLAHCARLALGSWPWTLAAFGVCAAAAGLMALGLWYLCFLLAGAAGYAVCRIMVRAFRRDPAGETGRLRLR